MAAIDGEPDGARQLSAVLGRPRRAPWNLPLGPGAFLSVLWDIRLFLKPEGAKGHHLIRYAAHDGRWLRGRPLTLRPPYSPADGRWRRGPGPRRSRYAHPAFVPGRWRWIIRRKAKPARRQGRRAAVGIHGPDREV